MFTSMDKAIAGLAAPLVGFGVSAGLLPADLATPEFTAALVTILTALAVYFVPNKEKADA